MTRTACATALAVALLAGCKKENAYVAPPPPQVGVAHPVQRPVTPYLESTGNTVAYNQVDLVARVEGFLQSINYQDGATVKTGTNLFVIEPAPYQAKLQQSQAQLDGAKAELKNAEVQFERQATLLAQNVTAQNTYDQSLATRDSDRANVQNQTAGVALAGINYGYTQVAAPFDGVVTNHLVSVGELVGVNGPTKLSTIIQLSPIYVTFNISEQDVLRIRAEMVKSGLTLTLADLQKVPIEVGLMTEQGFPHSGHLDYVAPDVDPSSGTLMVRGIFENGKRSLLPGYFVRIRVPMHNQTAQALLVPDTALGSDQAGRYLLVVNKDNVVEQRTVKVGQPDGALRVITDGLKPDDQVMITGLARAVVGEKVSPQPAPMPEA